MPNQKVITDKDGRMQTVPVSDTDAQAAVAKARRELRDMLAGNTPFHTDSLGPTPKLPEPEVHEVDFDPTEYLGACMRDRRLERIAREMGTTLAPIFEPNAVLADLPFVEVPHA